MEIKTCEEYVLSLLQEKESTILELQEKVKELESTIKDLQTQLDYANDLIFTKKED